MRRHATVAVLLLLIGCRASATLPEASPASPAASVVSLASDLVPPSTAVRPRLEVSLSRHVISAGACTVATVTVPVSSAEVARVGLELWGPGGGWEAVPWSGRVRHGRTQILACPGWSGGPVRVRAVAAGARPSLASPLKVDASPWAAGVQSLIAGLPASASLVVDGVRVYGHDAFVPRQPASNEKLLLSMTALDELGPDLRIPTTAAARAATGGVVHGDLWVIGGGDPELGAAGLERLARRVRALGITRVTGSVVGDTSAFRRDRDAPGWHAIALRFIGLPTALSFEHNVDAGGYVFDPERRAAAALSADLRRLGVRVGGAPRAGAAPAHPSPLARVRSAPLAEILARQNALSDNLDAETLSKLLGAREVGSGSIAGGARVIQRWAKTHGAGVRAVDASGLSYRDRVTSSVLAMLLDAVRAEPWGTVFRGTLPKPGEGTLGSRLAGLPVRAKTGTLLRDVSALSGYVRLADGRWASFSILSQLPKDEAVALEDALVRLFATYGSVTSRA